MSVAYDNSVIAIDYSVTSLTTGSFTISGSDRAAFLSLGTYASVSSITTACGGQSGSAISGATAATSPYYLYGYAVTNPSTGSQTASASWATSATASLLAITATGVNQTTPLNNGVGNNGGYQASIDLSVTSASGDLTTTACFGNYVWTSDQTDRIGSDVQAADTGPGTGTTTHTWTHSIDNVVMIGANFVNGATRDQEGFRWGVDDDTESAHTWEAAQDTNITIADTQSRLVRILVNATGDPSSVAYTLRSQKNGSGGYVAVPVGSTTTTSPPTAPSATVTTVGTAADPWTINRSTASTGDLVVFILAWDDSTNTTAVTAPAGVNSETAVSIAGPVASASTEMRMQAWYYVATGAWSSGTLSFDPNATETVRAVSFTIPTGQFNASDPIGWANTTASSGTAETNVNSPTGTAESDDGNGRIYIAFGSDADALTVPGSNWNTINNSTGGGVGLCVGSRDTLASNSESVEALTATIAGDSWASLAFVVKPNVANNEVYITTSANITAGGESTTARLTAPSGKSTSDFVTGRRWDDENGTDTIDITTDDYTEVEWLVALSSTPVDTDYYEFRVYAGSNALDTYTLTPKWTVGSGGGAVAVPQRTLLGVGLGLRVAVLTTLTTPQDRRQFFKSLLAALWPVK